MGSAPGGCDSGQVYAAPEPAAWPEAQVAKSSTQVVLSQALGPMAQACSVEKQRAPDPSGTAPAGMTDSQNQFAFTPGPAACPVAHVALSSWHGLERLHALGP